MISSATVMITNSMTGSSVQYLWSLFSSLELVTYLGLTSVPIPANVAIIQEFSAEMTSFSVEALDFASEKVLNSVLNLTEIGPFKEKFEKLGFEECNFILAMNADLINITIMLSTFVISS